MAGLPSGTVTFLFTDIEGSTRLLHKLGQHRYDELLSAHQKILRAGFTAHEGRVVDSQGDSFFVAFRTASDAVAAAVDVQRDLAAHKWPDGAEVKVRMGLHTGEPKVGEERYVGIGVHRAARIGAAGHGGQVLLSWTTKGLAEEDLPAGVTIRDLGERRLKDIEQPQHLYQLVIEGLESDFGPLNTLDVALARKRRRMYAGSALIGVLAAAVAIPVFAFAQGGSSSGVTTQGNAVAVIDPSSNRVTDVIAVGARPGSIASGSGSIWVANVDDQSVSRIDPATRSVTHTLSVSDTPTGLAASRDATWVVGPNPTSPSVDVRRIDPQFNTVRPKIKIPNAQPGGPGSVAAVGKTVWVAPSWGFLTRLNPGTGRPADTIDPNGGPAAVAVGADAVWFTDREANTVTRVDPTGLVKAITVGHDPSAIAIGSGAVWVVDSLDDAVVRIDPSTQAVTTTIPVGQEPVGIAVGPGSVWVANSSDGTVSRIDPARAKVIDTVEVGGSPQSVVVADGRVWVAVDRQTIANTSAASSGGTLRLSSKDDVGPMDPAIGGPWQLLDATCAKLLNYPDKPAPAGSRLEPEVAQSLPTRSTDGKTYTFTIRKGFRFSPPSNEPVTAQTFKHVIERSLSPILKGGYSAPYLDDVVGAKAYVSGKAAHISGIVVRGSTLTVHLLSPEPLLPTRLALPSFCAVPLGTPPDPKGLRTIASAGPYYVRTYTPGQGIVLERNPNYTGSRPHHADRIVLTEDISQKAQAAGVVAGTTDYALGGVAQGDVARIKARYGPASPATRKGRQQYFVNPELALDFIVLNSHRPLFHNVRLRQAVNYAIDRRALTRVGTAGGSREQPTDQNLPPGMAGFKNAHIYPFTPNLSAARRLAGRQARTAILYACNNSVCDQLTQIVKNNLAAIGIQVVAKKFSRNGLAKRLSNNGEPYDLAVGMYGWGADYPDPSNFLNNLLGPGSVEGFPTAADPSYLRQASAAFKLTGPSRYLAYGKLDVDTNRNSAPWVPIGNQVSQDFLSARIGCQVYQPVYGMDLAALCIKH